MKITLCIQPDCYLRINAVAGVKRRPDPLEGPGKEPRGADSSVGASRGAVNAGAAKQEEFNEHFLKFYYKYLFPYNQMFRWLAYGHGGCCSRMMEISLVCAASYARHYSALLINPTNTSADPDSTNPKVRRDYFLKREFTFTMANDVYIRYLSFRDEAALMKAVNARMPEKIDIGPVYNQTVRGQARATRLPW